MLLNVCIGFLFAFSYCIAYTCSRTLSNFYHLNALQVGLVLLSFGLGKSLVHKST